MNLTLLLALAMITFCSWLAESKRCKQYTNEEAESEFEKNYQQSQKYIGKIHKNIKKQGIMGITGTKSKTRNERKQKFKEERDRINKANKANPGFSNKANPQFCQVLNEFSYLTQEEMEAGFKKLGSRG